MFSASVHADESKNIDDVRLLIDVSGSMKKNDAKNLRRPAVELLVKLLPEKSHASIWTFDERVEAIVPQGVVNKAWRDRAIKQIPKINSDGLFTDIGGVLEKATQITNNSDNSSTEKSPKKNVILLTDGMVDISKDPADNQTEWRRITDEVLPRLQSAGYVVHTIALSDNADTDLLNKLSLSTDGVAAIAKDADELLKIFLNALDSSAPPKQVPLKGNRFVVDSSVEEFTALVFPKKGSKPVELLSPEKITYQFQQTNDDVNWFRTDEYDLLTVQRPVEGEWALSADLSDDSRVTIVSDLNLVVKPLSNNGLKGDPLTLSVFMEEDGKKITRKDLLGIIDVSYSIQRYNDGEAWFDAIPIDLELDPTSDDAGVFTTELSLFDKVGIYEIKIIVDGKSFIREYTHSIEIREPFTVETEFQVNSSETHVITKVTASDSEIDIAETSIVARVKNPSGNNVIKPLKLTGFDNWELDFTPGEEGVYLIDLKIKAVNKNGEEYDYAPETISIKYPENILLFEEDPEEPNEELDDSLLIPTPSDDNAVNEETINEELSAEELIDEDASEEEPNKLWLYIGLGLGNVFILALAFFAYRMIMGGNADKEIEALEQAVNGDAENDKEEDKETEEKSEEDGDVDKEKDKAVAAAEPESSEEETKDDNDNKEETVGLEEKVEPEEKAEPDEKEEPEQKEQSEEKEDTKEKSSDETSNDTSEPVEEESENDNEEEQKEENDDVKETEIENPTSTDEKPVDEELGSESPEVSTESTEEKPSEPKENSEEESASDKLDENENSQSNNDSPDEEVPSETNSEDITEESAEQDPQENSDETTQDDSSAPSMTQVDTPEDDPMPDAFDLGSEDEVEGITDVEFSLDDFEDGEEDTDLLDAEIDNELSNNDDMLSDESENIPELEKEPEVETEKETEAKSEEKPEQELEPKQETASDPETNSETDTEKETDNKTNVDDSAIEESTSEEELPLDDSPSEESIGESIEEQAKQPKTDPNTTSDSSDEEKDQYDLSADMDDVSTEKPDEATEKKPSNDD